MQSSIYNFYCLNTLAKHFYRLNPTLSYSNYKISLTPDILVSSVSNIIPSKLIVFETDVQSKNKRFSETVLFSRYGRIKVKLNSRGGPDIIPIIPRYPSQRSRGRSFN